ncbi:MAG: hypothetical protein WBK76_00645 [Candidatus Saccharimonadales bacterium]
MVDDKEMFSAYVAEIEKFSNDKTALTNVADHLRDHDSKFYQLCKLIISMHIKDFEHEHRILMRKEIEYLTCVMVKMILIGLKAGEKAYLVPSFKIPGGEENA